MRWTNSKEEMDLLLKERKSNKIDYDIPNDIIISTDMKDIVVEASIIVMAVPAKFIGSVSSQLKEYYKSGQVICIASKGIEQDTCLFLYDVVRNNIKTNNIAVISGYTFAGDLPGSSGSSDPAGFSGTQNHHGKLLPGIGRASQSVPAVSSFHAVRLR